MKKGFTLIELLIVIGIIGILAAIAMFGVANAYPRARDTRRKSDLKQIQVLVERDANQNNDLYPAAYGDVCTAAANCPTDPLTGADYNYQRNSTRTEYVLSAGMEIDTPANCTAGNCFWTICWDGRSEYNDLAPTGGGGLTINCYP